MTPGECHRKRGQPLKLCEAYQKAGLHLSQVSYQYSVDERGLTLDERRALDTEYTTNLPPMGECSPTCVMCHPELYDRSQPDGLRR